ncbi:MAG: FAD-binding protein [Pseudomonadales bacterium]
MSDEEVWDHSVDVLVVGSGNGAMTAALCCYEMGTQDVLVIEKADKFGGTSSISGGGVWVPCNRYAKAAGADDSLATAREYLRQTIPSDQVPEEMLDTYVEQAPKMIDFLHERTRVRYLSLYQYPDYYTNLESSRSGHRSMEPEPINVNELGDEWDKLVNTHQMMYLFNIIGITQDEAHILVGRLQGWLGLTLKLLFKYFFDLPWRLKSRRARRCATGCAGVARLRVSMQDRDMPLWLNTAMTNLITENGKVTGVEVERDGNKQRIQARKGVILSAGGFEHNQSMREQYLPQPTNHLWSAGCHTNTGDAIRAGLELGAATRMMSSAWWCTTISVPGEEIPRLSIQEKSFPGSVLVSPDGKRIANESQNYMAYQLEFFEVHSEERACIPSYLIFDAKFRASYIVGPLLTSSLKPDWTIPQSYYDEGFLAKADTLDELARKINVDPKTLQQTVSDLNSYAGTGKDLEFQRGDAVYDRYYGDPSVKPNPCLAPIAKPPFYALKQDPGDFGTNGGLVTNVDAQVLKENGEAIQGLYAVGNCAAPVLPTYPGPGSTLGTAMTFAWQAAKKITGYNAA